MKKNLFMIALGFTGAMIANFMFYSLVVMAEADNNPATDNLDRYLPYDGYLELDGEAVSADDMLMRFTIYDDNDNSLWTENQPVNIYNGKFSAELGQTTGITNTVFDAENIFIGIEIQSNNQWIALSGRQQITPVPFAMWAGQGSDFIAAGSFFAGKTSGGSYPDWLDESYTHGLKVFAGSDNAFFGLRNRSDNGDANSYDTVIYYGDDTSDSLIFTNEDNGDLMTLDGSGNLAITGSVSAAASQINATAIIPSYQDWNSLGTGDGGAAIYNDNSNYEKLMIVGNTSAGGDRIIGMWDDVFIDNNLTVGDNLTVTGVEIDGDDNDGSIAALKIEAGDQTMLLDGNEIDSNGSLHFQNNSEDDTIVHGSLQVSKCRICYNYADSNQHEDTKKHVCVKMEHNNRSGVFYFRGDVGSDDTFELVFLCDDGGNTVSDGWVGH